MNVFFKTHKVSVEGVLNNSQTALAIYDKLPLDSKVNTWGEEIYFTIPLTCKSENSTLDVEIGDIAYWPQGKCLCIFFGKTPASYDNRPRPASEVNIIGKVISDIRVLKKIKSGDKITVYA